jgi:hypothetical protein
MAYNLAISSWSSAHSGKSWGRVFRDSVFRYFASSFNVYQLQYSGGSTRDNFILWAKQTEVDFSVEYIGQGAHLLWMGEKRMDRVILYIHGGLGIMTLSVIFLPLIFEGEDLSSHT